MKRFPFLLILFASVTGFASEPTFERDILLILSSHCLQCHGGLHRKGMHDTVTLHDKSPTRPVLADWITSPKNALFARIKHLLRGMLLSRAYQRSHVALVENEQDKTPYSHATCKVLAPEAFWECLVLSSGGDPDKRAISGASQTTLGSRGSFLKLFDTDEMDGAPSDYTHGIPQVLTLLNDSAMHKPNRLVKQVVREKGEPDEIITRLYIAVLSRRPHEEELKVAREFNSERKGRQITRVVTTRVGSGVLSSTGLGRGNAGRMDA